MLVVSGRERESPHLNLPPDGGRRGSHPPSLRRGQDERRARRAPISIFPPDGGRRGSQPPSLRRGQDERRARRAPISIFPPDGGRRGRSLRRGQDERRGGPHLNLPPQPRYGGARGPDDGEKQGSHPHPVSSTGQALNPLPSREGEPARPDPRWIGDSSCSQESGSGAGMTERERGR